ncbi:MAG: hypothetical protein P8L18_02550 [Verrucomicrobiota bacterium]|nr:hypothetical protein [Verrucomicrobiota bacterium]
MEDQNNIYCTHCGESNKPNLDRCEKCNTPLQQNTKDTLETPNLWCVPYKNKKALISYYVGIVALFPVIGLPLAVASIILGRKGTQHAKQFPEKGGKVHAWIGIILGAVSMIYNVPLSILIIKGILSN